MNEDCCVFYCENTGTVNCGKKEADVCVSQLVKSAFQQELGNKETVRETLRLA